MHNRITAHCVNRIRGRMTLAILAGVVTGLPLVVLAVRGFPWGADVLDRLDRLEPPPS
jgi:hypothetical protein